MTITSIMDSAVSVMKAGQALTALPRYAIPTVTMVHVCTLMFACVTQDGKDLFVT